MKKRISRMRSGLNRIPQRYCPRGRSHEQICPRHVRLQLGELRKPMRSYDVEPAEYDVRRASGFVSVLGSTASAQRPPHANRPRPDHHDPGVSPVGLDRRNRSISASWVALAALSCRHHNRLRLSDLLAHRAFEAATWPRPKLPCERALECCGIREADGRGDTLHRPLSFGQATLRFV